MTALDQHLRDIGVIAKPQPPAPSPPVVTGWKPKHPGDECPF